MPAVRPPLVEFKHVTHYAGGRAIVADVSWRVSAGEHWVLLGANGAGKTTLLKMICGYLWPNGGGEILRDGQTGLDLPMLRRQIGWLTSQLNSQIPPQELALETVVSGRYAQIGLKRLPGSEPTKSDLGEAAATMVQIGCADLAERHFGTLSQGEQQKVLIGRAYMARRKLLILDEPCAGLDPAARESFLTAVERLARQPDAPSLLLVTHHVEEIMPAFGQTLALRQGHILRSGPTTDVIDRPLLEELYGRPIRELSRHADRYWLAW